MNPASRLRYWSLQPIVLSLALLPAAWLLAPYSQQIPDSFSGVWRYGPQIMFAASASLGVIYRRGRVVLVALLLALGTFLIQHPKVLGGLAQIELRIVLLTWFIPVNLALVGWFTERGVFTDFGLLRFGLLLVQLLAVASAWYAFPDAFSQVTWWLDRLVKLPGSLPLPAVSYLILSAAALMLLVFAVRERSHFGYGLFAGFAGFLGILLVPGHEIERHGTSIAVGLILSIAILRDAYNMAYRDELTALPQRRSLNELMMSLTGTYSVAMMDVDHFKKFNDTHGHDTGDDVLRMMASHIGRVRDGGRAFRYGGEEFTVIFPGKVKEQTLRSLEAVREAIENYEMVIREPRPLDEAEPGDIAQRGKGAKGDARTVSVTISIGVADRTDRNQSPDDVIKKADEALYAAKKAGRNRVVMSGENPGANSASKSARKK